MGSDWRKFIYLSVAILLVNEFIVGWKNNPSRDTSDPGVLPTVDDHKASDVANVNVSRQVDEKSPVVVPPSVRDIGNVSNASKHPEMAFLPTGTNNMVAERTGNSTAKENRWIPLTQDERSQYLNREKLVCGNPFRHCCLGQGRQLLTRHKNISQLYIKWSESLANITTLLDYMSQHEIPCNIWFFGMSLAGDQTIGALCELMRDAGYRIEAEECVPYANERWNEKAALNCSMIKEGMPTSQYYQLMNPNRTYCPRVTLAHSTLSSDPLNASHLYSTRGGVMVVNHGVHCSEPGCVTTVLKTFFTDKNVLSMREQQANNNTRGNWKILYRETERQHFATSNGYHEMGATKKKCRALKKVSGDYRNEEAKIFLHKLALTTNKTIPIIPLAKASEPLHFMHAFDSERKKFDCTHYVYSPWRFKLTWDGIIRGLKRLEHAE